MAGFNPQSPGSTSTELPGLMTLPSAEAAKSKSARKPGVLGNFRNDVMVGPNVIRADQHAGRSVADELDRADLEFDAPEFRTERCWVEEWGAVANDFLKVQ